MKDKLKYMCVCVCVCVCLIKYQNIHLTYTFLGK